jgi:hypothetical protein
MIQSRRRVVAFSDFPYVLRSLLRGFLEHDLLQDDGATPDISSIDTVEISFGVRVSDGVHPGVSLPSSADVPPGPPVPGVIPNIDPYRGYEGDAPLPNGEGAHPHDDATGHVTRTHEDFGPRIEKKHITDLPSWGKVGC